MRAALALLFVTSLAHAAPGAMVTPPKGWLPDPERAAGVAQKEQALKHFGGAKVVVATEAYVAAKPDVALFVTRVTSEALLGPQPAAARVAVDEFAGKPFDGPDAYDPETRQLVVRTDASDAAVGTRTTSHLVVVFDQTRVISVRGDCLSGPDAESGDLNACTQALATLDAGVPLDQRIAVTLAARDVTPAAPTEDRAPVTRTAPSITDGQDVHLAPMTIAQAKGDPDRRPIYIGAGIVVLAVVFWWNRRQRERFEREDEGGEPRRAPSRGDDDADDLAAAARGDEPKDEA